jgi:hypothetical protein
MERDHLSRAVETGRARFLLLAAALVGIAFNVKMLVAFGVAPAFALVRLIGVATTFRRRFGQLVQAGGGAVRGVGYLEPRLRSDAGAKAAVCRQYHWQFDV